MGSSAEVEAENEHQQNGNRGHRAEGETEIGGEPGFHE